MAGALRQGQGIREYHLDNNYFEGCRIVGLFLVHAVVASSRIPAVLADECDFGVPAGLDVDG